LKSNPWFPVFTSKATSSPEEYAMVQGGKRQISSGRVIHIADRVAAETRFFYLSML